MIDDFVREYSGLNSIPEEYREKAYKKAYDKALIDSNPPNPKDIYNNLNNLIEVFY